jgi:hypothetical protein
MIEDTSGDALDAVLCALQAAWSCRQEDYGIPRDVNPIEGWIVDPTMTNDAQ